MRMVVKQVHRQRAVGPPTAGGVPGRARCGSTVAWAVTPDIAARLIDALQLAQYRSVVLGNDGVDAAEKPVGRASGL
jgi:hypothetical protein